jgi:branched-chain amino acid aminotransferase
VATATIASVDGEILPPAEARISILDEGLVRGDGAFEVVKLYRGRPFRLEAHLDRLGRSAGAIHLRFGRPALAAEIAALLGRDEVPPEGCLRVVITRGGRRVLTAEDVPPFADHVAIALIEFTPSEILAGVKSLSYAANMQATRIASSRGADEAVYVRPDGVVLEAPTSSILWADADGTLRTPALGAGILDSITRRVIVEAMDVEEGEFGRAELLEAREAFLASTNREIQAVSAVDGQPIELVNGPVTEQAADALAAAVERELASAPA